jgi:hypothetical protein
MTSIPRTRAESEVSVDAVPAKQRRRIVTIERRGRVILIKSVDCARFLAPLRTVRHVPTYDPTNGCRVVRMAEPLIKQALDSMDQSVLSCPAGLGAVASHLLERAGYEVMWSGDKRRSLERPNNANVEPHGRIDEGLLSLVRTQDRGLIRYDRTGANPAWIVAQIALAYPKLKMAVLASRVADVRDLAGQLRPWLSDVSYATGRSQPAEAGRIHISTPWSLGFTPLRAGERKLVIFLDAAGALGKKPRHAIRRAVPRARLYGLLDRAQPIAPRDADGITALFGLNEIVIPRHGYRVRPVEVVSHRIGGGPAPIPGSDMIALKRYGLWRHPVRNRRIARLAQSLVTDGLDPCQDNIGVLAERLRGVTSPRVLILVENLDHALALADHLPEWALLVGEDANATGLSHRERRRLRRDRRPVEGIVDRAIATLAGIDATMLSNLDVLIRADGGARLPAALVSNPIDSNRVLRPLLLIDFTDHHHPVLRRSWRSRREAYVAQGWSVDGMPPTSAIERFLASRTEVKR